MKLPFFATLASTLLFTSFASASLGVTIGNVTRTNPDGSSAARDFAHHPEAIDNADCAGDVRIGIDLTTAAIIGQSYTLQAWAGSSDCTREDARALGTGACRLVIQPGPTIVGATHVDVAVRDIVGSVGSYTSDETYKAADPNVCSAHVNAPGDVYLFLTDASGAVVGAGGVVHALVVLGKGPGIELGGLSATSDSIRVTSKGASFWTQAGSPSIELHCAARTSCEEGSALGSAPSPVESSIACGKAAGADHTADLTGLSPGTSYEVSATVLDEYGNASNDSPPLCISTLATPSAAVPESAAPASSSGCSTSPGGASGSPWWALLAGFAFFALRGRRRFHDSCRDR